MARRRKEKVEPANGMLFPDADLKPMPEAMGGGGAPTPDVSGQMALDFDEARRKGVDRIMTRLDRTTRVSKGRRLQKAGTAAMVIANLVGWLPLAKEVLGGASDGVSEMLNLGGAASKRQEEMQRSQELVIRERQRIQREQQKVAQLRQINMQRLAMANPELAKQLMAGRVLPQGATVIGGQPRVDLMEQVADAMSRGEFNDVPPGVM